MDAERRGVRVLAAGPQRVAPVEQLGQRGVLLGEPPLVVADLVKPVELAELTAALES